MAFHRVLDGNRLYLGFVSGNMDVLRRGGTITFKEGALHVRLQGEGPSYAAANGLVLTLSEQMRSDMMDPDKPVPVCFPVGDWWLVTAVFGRTPKLAGEAVQRAMGARS